MCVIKIQHFDGISSTHVLVIASIDVRCRCVCMLASPIWSPHYRGHGQRQGQRSVVWIPKQTMGGEKNKERDGEEGKDAMCKMLMHKFVHRLTLKYIYPHVHMYTHTAGKLYIHHPKVDSTHSTSPPHIQRYYFHEDSLEQSMDFLHTLQIGPCSFRTSSISHLSETRWWKPSHKPECQEQDVRFCVSGVPREKGNVCV